MAKAWPWCGHGQGTDGDSKGMAWAQQGYGQDMAWAWQGHCVGMAKTWHRHGKGTVWIWQGYGVGMVTARYGDSNGTEWAQQGWVELLGLWAWLAAPPPTVLLSVTCMLRSAWVILAGI